MLERIEISVHIFSFSSTLEPDLQNRLWPKCHGFANLSLPHFSWQSEFALLFFCDFAMPLFLGFALLRFHFGYSVLAIRRKNARVLPTFRNKIVKIGGSTFFGDFGDHSCNISRRPHFLAQYSEIQLTYATTITLINLLKEKFDLTTYLQCLGSGSRLDPDRWP